MTELVECNTQLHKTLQGLWCNALTQHKLQQQKHTLSQHDSPHLASNIVHYLKTMKATQPLMCRGCSSMCRYVQSDDLEPRAWHGKVPAWQASGAVTHVAQPPQPHNPSNSQHTATTHPHQLLRSAPNLVEISSISGKIDPQWIGVWSLTITQDIY